jgi:hypothetical protein
MKVDKGTYVLTLSKLNAPVSFTYGVVAESDFMMSQYGRILYLPRIS